MRYEFRRLGDGRKGILRETKRAVTRFGGLVVLVELWRRMGLVEAVRERLPFTYRSNNASRPEHILLAFWLGVVAGARRFAHLEMLRADRALQELCGVRAFPCDDTVRNFFRRFGAAQVAAFFRRCGSGCSRSSRRARVCSIWIRRFCSSSASRRARCGATIRRVVMAAVTGRSWRLSANRCWCCTAGCGPVTRPTIAARSSFSPRRCRSCPQRGASRECAPMRRFSTRSCWSFSRKESCRIRSWCGARNGSNNRCTRCGSGTVEARTAVSEFTLKLPSWARPRRFIVVRLQLTDPKEERLIAVPGYEFRVFVTNRAEAPEWLWRHYDQRAAIEPRFSELKEDLAADDFCLRKFFATEAAFRSVLFVFNLLSVLQSIETKPGGVPQRPATLRQSIFLCGAIAGRTGHNFVLYLSSAWGGLATRKTLAR